MNSKKSVLLIHPPVVKPGEPPAGIARLYAALRFGGIPCRLYDASIEGILEISGAHPEASDNWSRRAVVNADVNLKALRSPGLYAVRDRYKKAVMDVNRLLTLAGDRAGVRISLSNYGEKNRTPTRSGDLVSAAERFEDNPFYPFFRKRLEHLFEAQTPDIVGLSVNFMSQALCAFAMAGFIRKRLPEVRIVLGGGLITSWKRVHGSENPFQGLVDDLVEGPGETALLSMATGITGPKSVDTLSNYSTLPLEAYLSPGRVLPYSTSNGCYWRRCAFCPENAEGGGYFPHDAREVLLDLRQQVRETSPSLIHFLDNALSPRFMKAIAENPPGVPWYGFARITEHLADPHFVSDLKASGCVMLKLGVESGDQAVLDALGKGVSLDTISLALTSLKKASIGAYVYLLFGTPAEDEYAARRTLAFSAAHSGLIDFLNLAVFNLPAGSREAQTLNTVDFYEGDLSLYKQFDHPKGWNRDRVRRFLSKEFRRHEAIRPILANDPPFFTSNHAPFLVLHCRQIRR
ncbi:MAG: B12-binding domain-containing radical SAM protein [Desulfobacterales bacterium]